MARAQAGARTPNDDAERRLGQGLAGSQRGTSRYVGGGSWACGAQASCTQGGPRRVLSLRGAVLIVGLQSSTVGVRSAEVALERRRARPRQPRAQGVAPSCGRTGRAGPGGRSAPVAVVCGGGGARAPPLRPRREVAHRGHIGLALRLEQPSGICPRLGLGSTPLPQRARRAFVYSCVRPATRFSALRRGGSEGPWLLLPRAAWNRSRLWGHAGPPLGGSGIPMLALAISQELSRGLG